MTGGFQRLLSEAKVGDRVRLLEYGTENGYVGGEEGAVFTVDEPKPGDDPRFVHLIGTRGYGRGEWNKNHVCEPIGDTRAAGLWDAYDALGLTGDPWVIDDPEKACFFVFHGYEKVTLMRLNPRTEQKTPSGSGGS